jgi:hypothetical protein
VSVPPELLRAAGAGAGGPPKPPEAEPPQGAAPPGGSIATPQPREGANQEGMIKISMATKLLTQALGGFGPLSEEGKVINNALGVLIRKFGAEANKAEELIPAELQSMARSLPGVGGGSPVAKAMGAMPPTAPPIQPGA